jgi:copper(I)-binding protein
MLMKLGHDFAVGDRVALTLHFSDGGTLQVEAPVKKFVQADDHSLSPTPTATASS